MKATRAFCRQLLIAFLAASFGVWFFGSVYVQEAPAIPSYVIEQFGMPPKVPQGPISKQLQEAVQVAFVDSATRSQWDDEQVAALEKIAASNDPRIVWILADRLRFTWQQELHLVFAEVAEKLLGKKLETHRHWSEITNHLIAWDVPSYPGYLQAKRAIFKKFVPGWERIFVEGDIDWRLVSWGGVHIDDRPYNETDAICDCIPAADNPPVQSAAEASWLKDDDVVFGIEVNGEFRAYPRQIMEVREMVNDTLGGRDIALPYCSLCGAAQAYFTDRLPDDIERPILRTSGLLLRSNKVMYDLNSFSVFDTFFGRAVTGPLAEKKLQLERITVVTTDWARWKKAHPETTVLVEALALGRNFNLRNERDANGPIFPVGDVDPRLPVHEDVIGVVTATGVPVAFQRSKAFAALKGGASVDFEGARLVLDAGGLRAVGPDGADLGSHEAYWFAWSQFHPQTSLWPGKT